jgi:hypothetical protein
VRATLTLTTDQDLLEPDERARLQAVPHQTAAQRAVCAASTRASGSTASPKA